VPRIDCHAHIFTRTMPFVQAAHSRPDYAYEAETYLADLKRFGLTHGVIAAASLYGDYNDYTLAVLAAHANLRATVILSPDTDGGQLARLAGTGVVGVRLAWRRLSRLPDLGQDPWRSFLRRLSDAGLHVELLAGGAALPALLPLLAAAHVRVVIDHFGVPSAQGAQCEGMDAMLRAIAAGDTWVKLSAGFRLPPAVARACAARLLGEGGAERLLWGSDAPFINHEASIDFAGAIALYRNLVPDAATRERIDETAIKLYFR